MKSNKFRYLLNILNNDDMVETSFSGTWEIKEKVFKHFAIKLK